MPGQAPQHPAMPCLAEPRAAYSIGMPFPNTRKGRAARKRFNALRNKRMYEALRRQGHSKQSAARISNAAGRKRKRR